MTGDEFGHFDFDVGDDVGIAAASAGCFEWDFLEELEYFLCIGGFAFIKSVHDALDVGFGIE